MQVIILRDKDGIYGDLVSGSNLTSLNLAQEHGNIPTCIQFKNNDIALNHSRLFHPKANILNEN